MKKGDGKSGSSAADLSSPLLMSGNLYLLHDIRMLYSI